MLATHNTNSDYQIKLLRFIVHVLGEIYKLPMKINEHETLIPSGVNLNDELTVRWRRTILIVF